MKSVEKRGDEAYLLDGPMAATDEAGLLMADSERVDGILFAWPADQDAQIEEVKEKAIV